MKPLFCIRCHRVINIPKMFKSGNIKAEKPIKLGCSDKNCADHGGHAKLVLPTKQEETVLEKDHIET